ncbi:hypothetical protein QAD02_021306 [Eretmocerus hayati]|uniref:Uncharacterized protein n=1 Tax=Eretmocerus hayati TaxID=131215 RepID=A0ACC2PR86_9HYME|nr:hypothetical protein QAD02_021306 [Eretmocerus hayati]
MLPEQFDDLYQRTRQRLTKLKGPRAALDPELRLAAVLSYLVHSSSARKTAWSFYIGESTMYKLIPEVCKAIHLGLKDHYLKFPSTNEEWLEISNGFLYIFDFPNCIGALDGKHFRMKRPPHSGSWFWNFKKFYSIVLMAVCDAKRVFKWRLSLSTGSSNETTTFRSTNLGRALDGNDIPIIDYTQPLPRTQIPFPMYLIADGGFPHERYLLKPYQKAPFAPLEERIFNIRLGRARRVVERGFGTLVGKFKIFEAPLDFKLSLSELIIMAAVCLHNFLIVQDENVMRRYRYASDDEEDSDDEECDEETSAGSDHHNDLSNTSDSNSSSSSSMSVSADNDISSMSVSTDDDISSQSNSGSDSGDRSNSASMSSSDDASHVGDLSGEEIRDLLADYLMSRAGAVSWRWNLL